MMYLYMYLCMMHVYIYIYIYIIHLSVRVYCVHIYIHRYDLYPSFDYDNRLLIHCSLSILIVNIIIYYHMLHD